MLICRNIGRGETHAKALRTLRKSGEKIGEGGFGEVHVVEQREPVKRKVAVKIIKLGMDTCQVVARFVAERQALVLLDHPNIAKVRDAGAAETAALISSWNWSAVLRSPSTAMATSSSEAHESVDAFLHRSANSFDKFRAAGMGQTGPQ